MLNTGDNKSFGKPIQHFRSLKFDESLFNTVIPINDREQFLDAILETVPIPLYFKDLESRYQYCNKAFIEHLDCTRNEIIGKKTHEIHSQEVADFHCSKDNELIEKRERQVYGAVSFNKNAEERRVRFYKDVITDTSGELRGIVGTMYDITETYEKELKLQRMNRLLRSLMEVSQVVLDMNTMKELFEVVIEKALEAIGDSDFGCVLIKDPDDYLTIIVQRGYSKEESEGFRIKLQESFPWIFSGGYFDKPVIVGDVQEIIDIVPEIIPPEYKVRIQTSFSTPIIIDNELIALINIDSCDKNVFDDYDIELMTIFKNQIELVIRNMRLYQEIINISQVDSLTGLYNRGYFEKMIDVIVKRALRYDESFCLVVMDLNNLKRVNDFFGHSIGDKFINNFVDVIKEHIRESDLLARFGGDEFIAVFFNSDLQQLNDKFEKNNQIFMKQQLIEQQLIEYRNIIQSFSYGIAHFPRDSEKYVELVRIADERMYRYKRILKSELGGT